MSYSSTFFQHFIHRLRFSQSEGRERKRYREKDGEINPRHFENNEISQFVREKERERERNSFNNSLNI